MQVYYTHRVIIRTCSTIFIFIVCGSNISSMNLAISRELQAYSTYTTEMTNYIREWQIVCQCLFLAKVQCLRSVWSCDSSDGIATRYGMNVAGIETLREQDFPQISKLVLGPTHTRIKRLGCFCPWVKQPGCSVNHPLLSRTKVKERVELYTHSPSGL
jgi:hypothetical protein